MMHSVWVFCLLLNILLGVERLNKELRIDYLMLAYAFMDEHINYIFIFFSFFSQHGSCIFIKYKSLVDLQINVIVSEFLRTHEKYTK